MRVHVLNIHNHDAHAAQVIIQNLRAESLRVLFYTIYHFAVYSRQPLPSPLAVYTFKFSFAVYSLPLQFSDMQDAVMHVGCMALSFRSVVIIHTKPYAVNLSVSDLLFRSRAELFA